MTFVRWHGSHLLGLHLLCGNLGRVPRQVLAGNHVVGSGTRVQRPFAVWRRSEGQDVHARRRARAHVEQHGLPKLVVPDVHRAITGYAHVALYKHERGRCCSGTLSDSSVPPLCSAPAMTQCLVA